MDFLLTPDPGLVFWTTVSFVILMVILKKYAWTPILDALNMRSETIEESLKAAERAKAEVENLVKVRQEMMDDARNERDELLKETRELKDKILSEAKLGASNESEKIISLARKQIEAEKNAAIKEMKKQVAELSIDIAGMLIQTELKDDQKQRAIIDKYLENINFN
ncbi:ATP synthase F0 subcomplex B subunit [Saccharicrinis carchari]|uniref:ATP synthase subunit b n=1 Tax=Saccharicrinis carchari TaxID=1168039 RepID=A0A521CMR9_SACCC|nr:F0F1 ATP synthase subunit B [Saccharicrinis carchari]SMO60726.1 ATP synthase F0 subcomplex B subunit [Saccharicrinis carchari]